MWAGPELGAGKHTIVFDYKSDGPGLGKGGTGVLSVDGKEVARNSMEHSTPITFPEDETFDIGQRHAHRLALIEYRYDVPFKFTGTINKVTFNLGDEAGDGRGTRAEQRPSPRPAISGAPPRPVRTRPEPDAMRRVLVLAAVAEAATGAALLLVPSLVGRLLLGEELTGVAADQWRVAGHRADRTGRRLLAGPGAGRHADLQRGSHGVSRLRGSRGGERRSAVAGGRPARDPDGASDSGRDKRQGDENIDES